MTQSAVSVGRGAVYGGLELPAGPAGIDYAPALPLDYAALLEAGRSADGLVTCGVTFGRCRSWLLRSGLPRLAR